MYTDNCSSLWMSNARYFSLDSNTRPSKLLERLWLYLSREGRKNRVFYLSTHWISFLAYKNSFDLFSACSCVRLLFMPLVIRTKSLFLFPWLPVFLCDCLRLIPRLIFSFHFYPFFLWVLMILSHFSRFPLSLKTAWIFQEWNVWVIEDIQEWQREGPSLALTHNFEESTTFLVEKEHQENKHPLSLPSPKQFTRKYTKKRRETQKKRKKNISIFIFLGYTFLTPSSSIYFYSLCVYRS